MRIGQIDFTRLVDIDRDVRFLPDRRNAADMIEVPVSQQDLFNDPPVFTAETHQIMPLCAGMKQFYTTDNQALSAYLDEEDGRFADGTVMARSEKELEICSKEGYLSVSVDLHQIAMDICTIVKGCVFEWCLTKERIEIQETLQRILRLYFASLVPDTGDL